MSVYITHNERYLLSQINDRYDVALKNDYDHIACIVAKEIVEDNGYEASVVILEDVKGQIEKRLQAAKNRHTIHELTCYSQWVQDLIDRIIKGQLDRIAMSKMDMRPIHQRQISDYFAKLSGTKLTQANIQKV
jgi:hypothetical protein